MPAWLSWLGDFWSSGKAPAKMAGRPRVLTFSVVVDVVYAADEDGNVQLVAITPPDAEWFRQWIDGQRINADVRGKSWATRR